MLEKFDDAPSAREDNAEVSLTTLMLTDPEMYQVVSDLDSAEWNLRHFKSEALKQYDEQDGMVQKDLLMKLEICGDIVTHLQLQKAELERARKEKPPLTQFERKVEGIKNPFQAWMTEAAPLAA